MRTAYRVVAVIVAVVFLAELTLLARLQTGAPPHQEVPPLAGDVPATMYLPGSVNQPGENNPFYRLVPLPPEQRPPGIVLVHGFTSDRQLMSSLARLLAQNGYGVLTIDVRGHGENRTPFAGEVRDDVATAVAYLRQSPLVDPNRIVVIGHSMGAGASLEYAQRDPNLKGAVMISGGFSLDGKERPKNTLFIFADGDPSFIRELSVELASHLAGADKIELGKTYGDFASGTAVEAIKVPRVNHVSIMWSPDAAAQIISWLDSVCGVQRASGLNLADPRLNVSLVILFLLALLMIPVGRVLGGLARGKDESAASRTGWIGVGAIFAALLLAMPFTMMRSPAPFVSLVAGDSIVSWFAIAGGLLIALIAFQYPDDLKALAGRIGPNLLAALIAFGAVYVLSAFDVTLHIATLTPERMVLTFVSAALMLPFFASFEVLLRRGSLAMSTLLTSIGLLLILLAMGVGLMVHALPFVLGLLVFAYVIQFIVMEIFTSAAYSVSGDLLFIAIFESLWVARLVALSMPILFKF